MNNYGQHERTNYEPNYNIINNYCTKTLKH